MAMPSFTTANGERCMRDIGLGVLVCDIHLCRGSLWTMVLRNRSFFRLSYLCKTDGELLVVETRISP